ncbi:initiator tRNA phosphoribosyl transferase [Morchella conica CCBAS932]|uniref:Initiator tRNA phosphoribosyl transferase n=1 Tax=Morchella conica CCBAS932 TaxID=1392247 RepID=A0A3N4KZS7_9PEZI|nr:initiator tRNA phosphoribosyl transferase [Morchella conica CCBAS932]
MATDTHNDVSAVYEEEFTFTPASIPASLTATFTPSFGSLANSVRRSSRGLRNRLHSIARDAAFVERVRAAYGVPVVTNARAGDWYVDPARRQGGVYFKSTDGHVGEWMFSLRRLNLGLLGVLEGAGGRGAIIVDSTRRGKRFPDSLSKTIPIWIAVMNKIVIPSQPSPFLQNPQAVPDSEASSINKKLQGFVDDFLALGLDLTPIKRVITKPLRPIWITPDSPLPETPPVFEEFIPLLLVTASQMVKGGGIEGEYIQGAGDDHEGWALESGLTPALFWAHHKALLAARNDDGLLELTHAIVSSTTSIAGGGSSLVKPTSDIYIGAVGAEGTDSYDIIINCTPTPITAAAAPNTAGKCQVVPFPIPEGKKGTKFLRSELPGVMAAVEKCVAQAQEGKKILVVCASGNEVAPAVALVVLCLYYDDEGRFRGLLTVEERAGVDKAYIRRRLAWISASRVEANPARAALNAVNSFLMERPA